MAETQATLRRGGGVTPAASGLAQSKRPRRRAHAATRRWAVVAVHFSQVSANARKALLL